MSNGVPPIASDELIYRRIASKQGWVDGAGKVRQAAFLPTGGDRTGVSLSRAAPGETPEQTAVRVAALGYQGTEYFVAAMRAATLFELQLPLIPDPKPDDTTHAKFDGWTTENRDAEAVRMGALKATTAVVRVFQPMPGQRPRKASADPTTSLG